MDTAAPLSAPKANVASVPLAVTPLRLMAGLTVLALGLRLIHLGSRPFWLDEAFSAWFSGQSFHYIWRVLPTYETHPPFYYSILKLWRMVAGGHVGMRGLSVLFGTLTVPVIMAIAWEQERQSATGRPMLRAGLAGFLAAASPMLMVIDQEARPYPLLTLAYSVTILALLRLVRQFNRGQPGSWGAWTCLGAGAATTCWSHYLGVVYIACLAIALALPWLSAPVSSERIKRGLVTAGCVALLYAPCLFLLFSRTHEWGTNWLIWDPAMLLQLLVLYTVPYEMLTIGSAVAALAMVLLLKRALATTWQSKGWNSERLMLLLWLGPPFIAAVVSAAFVPVFLARTLTGTLVPAYLMIAGAIARTDSARERRLITAAIFITLLPTAAVTALRPADERWDQLAQFLSRNVHQNDEIWLYPADTALPLSEVGARLPGKIRSLPETFPTLHFPGVIRAGWHGSVSATPRQAAAFANDPTAKHIPVIWLVTRQSGIFDPAGDMPAALARVRRAGPKQSWGYIDATPYYRRTSN